MIVSIVWSRVGMAPYRTHDMADGIMGAKHGGNAAHPHDACQGHLGFSKFDLGQG